MQKACLSNEARGHASAISSLKYPLTVADLLHRINTQPSLLSWLYQQVVTHAKHIDDADELLNKTWCRLYRDAKRNQLVFHRPEELKGYVGSRAAFASRVDKKAKSELLAVSLEELAQSGQLDTLEARNPVHGDDGASEIARERVRTLRSRMSAESRELLDVLLNHDCFKATGTIDQGDVARRMQISQPTASRKVAKFKREALAGPAPEIG